MSRTDEVFGILRCGIFRFAAFCRRTVESRNHPTDREVMHKGSLDLWYGGSLTFPTMGNVPC